MLLSRDSASPNREEPALFITVGDKPGGEFAVPAGSARVAAQAARHLTEYYPHTQALLAGRSRGGGGSA